MDQAPDERSPLEWEPTGVGSVDAVLEDVAAVAGAPVSEHVALFERAHEQLRRALDSTPDTTPDTTPDAVDGVSSGPGRPHTA